MDWTDREARNVGALLLRRLACGRITNDDFECAWPVSEDSAVRAAGDAAWSLYSDLRSYRLVGPDRLDGISRRFVATLVLFLKSDSVYRWPGHNLRAIYNWPLDLLTFGWWERRKRRRFIVWCETGAFKVWPFFSVAEYNRALARPPYLASSGAINGS